MQPIDSGELLLGADAIARHLGVKRSQVYRMTRFNLIPNFKVGGTVAASRTALNDWLAQKRAAA